MGTVYQKINLDRASAEHAKKTAGAGLQPPPSRLYFLANALLINRLD